MKKPEMEKEMGQVKSDLCWTNDSRKVDPRRNGKIGPFFYWSNDSINIKDSKPNNISILVENEQFSFYVMMLLPFLRTDYVSIIVSLDLCISKYN